MNYQQYYVQGGFYKIPVDLFNKLLDQNCPEFKLELEKTLETKSKIINKLLEQNKKMKDEIKHNSKVYKLQQENQELKKQYCERTDCGGRLGNSKKVEELIKENEKLKEELEISKLERSTCAFCPYHHYKLLYQKVKERNDKAIEYVENNTYTSAGSLKTTLYIQNDELYDFLEILKGNNEEVSDEIN